jgi:3-dehydrotetronate 4-kinase
MHSSCVLATLQCHPLTPMTDPNLVRFLQMQLGLGPRGRAGLIDYPTVGDSAVAIAGRIEALRSNGISIAIADASAGKD